MISLSLVLHELATNAAKYGALSAPDGTVEVGWTIDAVRGGFHLSWVERGGPPVAAPDSTGYGTKLITSLIRHNLGGELEQTYDAAGFSLHAFIPLTADSGPAADRQMVPGETHEDDSGR